MRDQPFVGQRSVVAAFDETRRAGHPLVACDVSPPRGAVIDTLEGIAAIPADFYCVAYAPGRAVRLDSLAMATVLHAATGRSTIWNLATRDMNALALENHLLGAEALGQPNVVIVRGDNLSERDRTTISAVNNVTPSGLIAAAAALNAGMDLRGVPLRAPTSLCIGATLDLGRGVEAEARLTARKVRAGAMFLVTQPVYESEEVERFLSTYRRLNGEPLTVPLLWGFPVLAAGSITFGEPPARWRQHLDAGRPGAELAAEELQRFIASGVSGFYLMPPILRGGARDYAAAAETLRLGFG